MCSSDPEGWTTTGTGKLLQRSSVSCLENPRDGEACCAAVSGVAQSWTRLKRLSSRSSSHIPALLTKGPRLASLRDEDGPRMGTVCVELDPPTEVDTGCGHHQEHRSEAGRQGGAWEPVALLTLGGLPVRPCPGPSNIRAAWGPPSCGPGLTGCSR